MTQISLAKYLAKEERNTVLTGQNLVGKLVQLGLKSLSEKSVKCARACLFCSLSTLPDALAKYQMVQDVKLAFISKACTGPDIPFALTCRKSLILCLLLRLQKPIQGEPVRLDLFHQSIVRCSIW